MMSWVLFCLWFALFLVLLRKFTKIIFPKFNFLFITTLWIIKILAGTFIWFIYQFYYADEKTGDIISYYSDAKELIKIWKENPRDFIDVILGIAGNHENRYADLYNNMRYWYEEWKGSNLIIEPRNMIRLNAIISLLGGGLFHTNTLFYSFFSYIGILLLIWAFLRNSKDTQPEWMLAGTVLFPSVLAWTSAAMRESPMMLGIGLTILGAQLNREKKWTYGLTSLTVGMWILVLFKTHVALTIFLPCVLFIASGWLRENMLGLYAITFFIILIILYSTTLGDLIFQAIAKKRENFINVSLVWQARSTVPVPEVPISIIQLPHSFLHALFNSYLQPMPWRISGVLDALAVMENIIFLILIVVFILSRKSVLHKFGMDNLLFVVSFLILQGTLIGLTTAVAGAIVRYKVSALSVVIPFLVGNLQKR